MAQLIAFSTGGKGILEALSSSMACLGSSCVEGVAARGSSRTFCGIIPFTHRYGAPEGEITVGLCGWDMEDEPQHWECSEWAAGCPGLADVVLSSVNHSLGQKMKSQ